MTHPNVAAFLRVIRAGESSQDESAYRVMFGGSRFDSFADHPRITNTASGYTSTAAGAYQFLSKTWDECAKALSLPDFSPESQDLAAVYLIKRRGALDDVIAGRLDEAVKKCAKEWASLPGSPYGQPTRTLEQAHATYFEYGGSLYTSDQRAEQSAESKPMAPFIIPAVIELAKLIPKLGGMFGGSEVAQRNVAAAGVVVDAVVGAVGASNAQEAVEKIAADPAAREAANKAVEAVWYQISEAGGGGIDGARKADAAIARDHSFLWSPSFWMGVLLLPIVYIITLNVVGVLGTAQWAPEARAGIAGMLTGTIVGGIVGYYYGQTTSRNRTP